MRSYVSLLLLLLSGHLGLYAQNHESTELPFRYFNTEWNTVMVEATYQINGPNSTGGLVASGTGFVLVRPKNGVVQNQQEQDGSDVVSEEGTPIFVTAAHVLNVIAGDFASLDMRFLEGTSWEEVKIPLRIRKAGRPLWMQHPVADVAVIPLTDHRIITHLIQPLVPTTWLATDQWLAEYQIHPGDEVTCLGFPEAISSQFGFPILRTGRIASFPIVPTVSSRPLYIDFPVYHGNSGGPVYVVAGGARGSAVIGGNSVKIIGLVTQKKFGNPSAQHAISAGQNPAQLDENHLADMHLGILEPASVILETLAQLNR